jgi:hypothetical protein
METKILWGFDQHHMCKDKNHMCNSLFMLYVWVIFCITLVCLSLIKILWGDLSLFVSVWYTVASDLKQIFILFSCLWLVLYLYILLNLSFLFVCVCVCVPNDRKTLDNECLWLPLSTLRNINIYMVTKTYNIATEIIMYFSLWWRNNNLRYRRKVEWGGLMRNSGENKLRLYSWHLYPYLSWVIPETSTQAWYFVWLARIVYLFTNKCLK